MSQSSTALAEKYQNLKALSNHSIPFQALSNIWQTNKKKTSEKVKVDTRWLLFSYWLQSCEVKISVELIPVWSGATLLPPPLSPTLLKNPLQSPHPKAGPPRYPLTSSTGRSGTTMLSEGAFNFSENLCLRDAVRAKHGKTNGLS